MQLSVGFLAILVSFTSAGAVTRPVFCAALLTTARTTGRSASVEPLRTVVGHTLRFRSLQNQMLTDVDLGRWSDAAAYVESLKADHGVGREFRGFAEVAAAKRLLEAELAQAGSVSVPGRGRRASSLGLAALPLYAIDTGAVGMIAGPLALGLIFANEFAYPRWRAFRDEVRGLPQQLGIIGRVLDEREPLARGGRALSIVRGQVRLPARVHRALLRRRSLGWDELRALLTEGAGDALQEVWFDSVFYTDLRSAEPRWLMYYRPVVGSASGLRVPPLRSGVRGLLTEY